MSRSSQRKSVCTYLRLNQALWNVLPSDLLETVQSYAVPGIRRSATSEGIVPKLFQAAIIISREKKRQWYITKGFDYIEGLNLQNTHPHLYQFCKRSKIHSIHQLTNFIAALRLQSGSALRLKHKEALLLIIWWDTVGRTLVKTPPD